jgi:probable rRNA maturation factor
MRRSGSCSGLLQITVTNLQRTIPINVIGLARFAVGAARFCLQIRKSKPTNLTRLTEILVLIVSDRRMAGLHRQFLGQSGSTDVLTFQHGEIFISAETARRHARRFGNSFVQELQLYVVHGLLHLHGFDDRSRGESRKMEAAQKRILRRAARLN